MNAPAVKTELSTDFRFIKSWKNWIVMAGIAVVILMGVFAYLEHKRVEDINQMRMQNVIIARELQANQIRRQQEMAAWMQREATTKKLIEDGRRETEAHMQAVYNELRK